MLSVNGVSRHFKSDILDYCPLIVIPSISYTIDVYGISLGKRFGKILIYQAFCTTFFPASIKVGYVVIQNM